MLLELDPRVFNVILSSWVQHRSLPSQMLEAVSGNGQGVGDPIIAIRVIEPETGGEGLTHSLQPGSLNIGAGGAIAEYYPTVSIISTATPSPTCHQSLSVGAGTHQT